MGILSFYGNKIGAIEVTWAPDTGFPNLTEQPVSRYNQFITIHGIQQDEYWIGWLMPVIKNVSNKQVKGLNIVYSVSSINCTITPSSSFNESYNYLSQKREYSYQLGTLASYSQAEVLFDVIKVVNPTKSFNLSVDVIITYDGIKEPIMYSIDFLNHYLTKRGNGHKWEQDALTLLYKHNQLKNNYQIFIYFNGKEFDDNKILLLGPLTTENFFENLKNKGYAFPDITSNP